MSPPCPPPAQLRSSAEAQIAGSPTENAPSGSPEALLHELQVHQIELEMQTATLRETLAALKASRDSYIDLYEFAPVGYLTLDDAGLIAGLNLNCATLLGASRSELLRQPFARFIAPECADLWHLYLRSVRRQATEHHCELTLQYGDGAPRVVQVDSRLLNVKNGDPATVLVTLTDISARKHGESAQQASEARLQAIFDASPDPLLISDAQGLIVAANRQVEAMLGYSSVELLGQSIDRLVPDRFRATHPAQRAGVANVTEVRRMGHGLALSARRKDGSECAAEINLSRVQTDQGVLFACALRDMTERNQNLEEIHKLAYFDTLTGLPNRSRVHEDLQRAMQASHDNDTYSALLFIDLDDFKTLNDTLGHLVGDQLLQQVAQRLTAFAGAQDTVARLGGDEFLMILNGLGRSETEASDAARAAAEAILAALKQTYHLGRLAHRSTASIGATLFKGLQVSSGELMKQTDLTVFRAKTAGRDNVLFFDPAMQAAVKARAAFEDDLRQSLLTLPSAEANEFSLHYQAQIAGQQLTGAEVLLRWRHPQRGMVSPADFIPLAEATALILLLGHWVLETACRQLMRWATVPALAHLTLAVNVSSLQFHQPDFVEQVLAVLKKTGADPQRLKLELTESLLVDKVQEIIEKMFALKARGVGFSLDDFGTGYSSLAYLKRMPLDQLKIDQSFVRDVLIDPNDAAIARTVIALAKNLGLGVIAEGVETAAQRDFLASSDCHAYQGYFFSRPLPLDDFEAFAQRSLA